MGQLDGKVAIITGAAGRLGAASVLAMVSEGAEVLAVDIDLNGAQTVCDQADELGGRAVAHSTDVSNEESVREMVAAAVSTFGGLDILFNNAGLVGREWGIGLLELEVDIWDEVLAVNLRGVMLGCKHAVPAMLERGGGSIINTSSDSSLMGDYENYAYAASKAGVNTLTMYVAAGFGKQNIRCNAISPGVHLREKDWETMQRAAGDRAVIYSIIQDHCLLPRLGTPQDIANAAVFLGSDNSSYITGQIIPVDGGLSSGTPHLPEIRRFRAGEPR